MRASLEERFWAKVYKNGPVPDPAIYGDIGRCWLWTGCTTPSGGKGYGLMGTTDGKKDKASRVVWILANGEIPAGMQVCHRCDNRLCVRPSHLFLGTAADDSADMMAKGRHVSKLHPEKHIRGVQVSNAKLTPAKVRKIRKLYVLGATQHELGRRFGVSLNAIFQVVHGITWKDVV